MKRMTLGELARIVGSDPPVSGADTVVGGLADDSRRVVPGDVFFCIPGAKTDGAEYVCDAAGRGAVAVVTQRRDLPSAKLPVVCTGDCRLAVSRAAAQLYAEEIGRLTYVGVTGTNGKTTTTYLTAAVLRAGGLKTAVIGTLGTLGADGSRVPSRNTTPGPVDLVTTLRRLTEAGYQAVVMEVSSQAIVQHRADFLPFSAAVWTNLSPEHFELHADLETYRTVKASWVAACDRRGLEERIPHYASVINLDDEHSRHFMDVCRGRVIGFSLGGAPTSFAGDRVLGEDPHCAIDAGRMLLVHGGRRTPVRLSLGGQFNLRNALAAASVGLARGIAPELIADALGSVKIVPGRFQPVPSGKRRVLIDYAHTSEGLENLLGACRQLVSGQARLIVVFGCGGDRDNTKRPRMGSSASRFADLCVITNDNPRTEDPARITGQILEGVAAEHRSRCLVEHDRRRAIGLALGRAGPDD
ncbi:MAG: UDP-N-acetylmuramoyl-L-alanyl-D-glutamate--2,6-diaminopimelate ligase, partial [Candidatus Riflebacteria bacterium]|nr:UDP-N-acetylmuramoyl-L-alanyl-D-glutamate--2,6-diaminopimelate ligase [Candidatus Riflebacteria bacterium]